MVNKDIEKSLFVDISWKIDTGWSITIMREFIQLDDANNVVLNEDRTVKTYKKTLYTFKEWPVKVCKKYNIKTDTFEDIPENVMKRELERVKKELPWVSR